MRDHNQVVGIAPSLLCADLLNLGAQIKIMDEFNPTWYHIDIMDGRFVPNFTFGPDLVKAVKAVSRTPIVAHLMCEKPEHHIKLFADAGADAIAFHIEAAVSPIRILNQVRSFGKKAGIVINPATPVNFLPYVMYSVDLITVMAIEPGFAGQPFIESTYDKIREIKTILKDGNRNIPVEVDGGIHVENGLKSVECGADILVAGYFSVFKRGGNIRDNYSEFVQALNGASS